MEVEEALQKLGFYGRWQTLVFVLLHATLILPCHWHIVSIVFIGYQTPHYCKIPAYSLVNESIPINSDGELSSCSMFVNASVSNLTTACVDGWRFEEGQTEATFIPKWDLVCERTYLTCVTQLLLTAGLLFGSLTFTRPAARFGSRQVFIITVICLALSGLLTLIVNRFAVFLFLKLLQGFFIGGTLICESIYLAECFSKESRGFYTTLANALWGPGLALTLLLAYLLADWTTLQICVDFYLLASVSFHIWWLYETVPWLHAKQKLAKAERALMYAAKLNNVTFTKPILKPLEDEEEDEEMEFENSESNRPDQDVVGLRAAGTYKSFGKINFKELGFVKDMHNEIKKKIKTKTSSKHQYSLFELFKNRYLLRNMLLGIVLLSQNLGCYSLFISTSAFPTKHYLPVLVYTLVAGPACIAMYHLCKRHGKKISIVASHLLAVVPMLACVAVECLADHNSKTSYITLALNALFFLLIFAASSASSQYAPELFPETLRIEATAICTCIGMLGTILASFSPYIIVLNSKAFYATLATSTLAGGLLTLALPDTRDKVPPRGIEDVVAWYGAADESHGDDGDDRNDGEDRECESIVGKENE